MLQARGCVRARLRASTGIRDQEFLVALGAADAGEAVLEIAALEELAHDCPDDRRQKVAIALASRQ